MKKYDKGAFRLKATIQDSAAGFVFAVLSEPRRRIQYNVVEGASRIADAREMHVFSLSP